MEFVDKFVNVHVASQAHTIFTPAGDAVMDFIGRTEELEADWHEIMRQIRLRSGAATLTVAPIGRKSVRDAAELKRRRACTLSAAARANENTATDLALQYAIDLRRSGYVF